MYKQNLFLSLEGLESFLKDLYPAKRIGIDEKILHFRGSEEIRQLSGELLRFSRFARESELASIGEKFTLLEALLVLRGVLLERRKSKTPLREIIVYLSERNEQGRPCKLVYTEKWDEVTLSLREVNPQGIINNYLRVILVKKQKTEL